MEVTQFEASAAAAAPFLAASRREGRHAHLARRRSLDSPPPAAIPISASCCCARLSPRRPRLPGDGDLRDRLREVLNSFDDEDAAAVFAAIRLANPGGLGAVPEQDVADAPTVGLLEAMGLAASRDRIAAAYVTDYVEIFEFGLRVLANARGVYGRSEPRRHHAAHGLSCLFSGQSHCPQARCRHRGDGARGGARPVPSMATRGAAATRWPNCSISMQS